MAVEYTNRKGQKYYLHQGSTKTGKPKYFFSMKSEGTLVETIPDGFEIYENPNAQVFLQRTQPQIITKQEIATVENGMKQFSSLQHCRIDVKKDTIYIYTADQDESKLSEMLKSFPSAKNTDIQNIINRNRTYSAMLRFVLFDDRRRIFSAERYCFLGSVDDWINIGFPDTLQNLVEKNVKHLGRNSFYELY